jgi:hypothetical protein
VSRLDQLADRYERHISAPWQPDLAGAQRIIFVVYPKEDERKLRVKMKEFEHRTWENKHPWQELNFTDVFPEWIAGDEYRDEYFRHPEDLSLKLKTEFGEFCAERLRQALTGDDTTQETVTAIYGLGTLYGFTRLHLVLQKIESDIRGRLVVFFPGTYDQNVYHLLDARDGWNYLATPITL